MDDPETSQNLLDRATVGDRGAIDDLIVRHMPRLLAWIRLNRRPIVAEKESTADVLQSACREVLEDLVQHEYRSEGHFRNWLYLAVERKLVDKTRFHTAAKRRAAEPDAAWPATGEPAEMGVVGLYQRMASPSEAAMVREDLQRFEDAFAALPDEYREVLLQARILGASYGEIAARLDRSEVAVRKIASRAAARLMRILTDP